MAYLLRCLVPASFDSFAAWKFCKRTTTPLRLLLLLLLLLLADAHHCIPSGYSHSKRHNTIRNNTTRMIHHTWDDYFLQAAPMLRNLSQQHHHNNKEPRHPKLSFHPFRQNLQIHCPPGTAHHLFWNKPSEGGFRIRWVEDMIPVVAYCMCYDHIISKCRGCWKKSCTSWDR